MKYPTLILLIFLPSIIFCSNPPIHKIDPSLLVGFTYHHQMEYIVLMKDRVAFKNPLIFQTKEEKANYVYSLLIQKASSTQKDIIDLIKGKGFYYQSFMITNAIKIKSDIDFMMYLAGRSDVHLIIDNAPIRMVDYGIDKNTNSARNPVPEWGIRMIKADSVWNMGIRGKGVLVSGQDTGYDWQVSPLKKKYKGYIDSLLVNHNFNWHDAIHKNNPQYPDSLINPCGYNSKVPCDDNNHGTHTMGTMVGEDENNQIGVAPEAQWIACRNMDRGWGQPSTYLECFEWLMAPYDLNGGNPDPTRSPHVINNSWFCSTEEGCNISNFILMSDVIKNLKTAGIVVVASAGNSGSSCGTVSGPPAIFESTFSVGATASNDLIAGFSSRGPVTIDSSMRIKPNVVAPGLAVRSVISNGTFASFNGTSMAGPHVAGVVALIISANPNLAGKVEVIEDIIESTAVRKTAEVSCGNIPVTSIPNTTYGYGRIDALAAVKKAISMISNVNDAPKTNYLIYPNPVLDILKITNDVWQNIQNITIYDATGKQWISKYDNLNEMVIDIDTSLLRNGLYFCKIVSSNVSHTMKFIKM